MQTLSALKSRSTGRRTKVRRTPTDINDTVDPVRSGACIAEHRQSIARTSALMPSRRHLAYPNWLAITSRAWSRAARSWPGSLPPPWAESGRPPPLPPRRSPTAWAILPAWTPRVVRLVVHRHDETRLALDLGRQQDHPRTDPVADRVAHLPERPVVGDRDLGDHDGTPWTSSGVAARWAASSRAWARWACWRVRRASASSSCSLAHAFLDSRRVGRGLQARRQ